MIGLFDATSFVLLGTTLFLGLMGMVACRLSEKRGGHVLCQLMFFFALVLVASATLFCLVTGNGGWFISGATLSVMVVGATLDCGGRQKVRPCH